MNHNILKSQHNLESTKNISTVNKKLKEYLLGGNMNLIGTVLSIRKALKLNKFQEYLRESKEKPELKHYVPEGYSILLYFDHRKGRITRHVFNPNLIFWGIKPLLNFKSVNKKETWVEKPDIWADRLGLSDMPEVQNKQPSNKHLYNYKSSLIGKKPIINIYSNDLIHFPDEYNLSFKTLVDGKINRHMINLFFIYILFDYLNKTTVYNTTDYEIIQRNKQPSKYKVTKHLGRIGVGQDSNLRPDAVIKNLDIKNILEYPPAFSRDIYIPKGISLKFSNIFEFNGINIKPKVIDETPQVIKDLKSVINANTIHNRKNLAIKIERFNKGLELKLMKLSNSD